MKSSHNKAQNSIRTSSMDIHHAIIQDCGTQTFRFNNKLAHIQQKYILQLPRHQQQMIYKIRLSSKTYAQIKGDHEKCPDCEEIFEKTDLSNGIRKKTHISVFDFGTSRIAGDRTCGCNYQFTEQPKVS